MFNKYYKYMQSPISHKCLERCKYFNVDPFVIVPMIGSHACSECDHFIKRKDGKIKCKKIKQARGL